MTPVTRQFESITPAQFQGLAERVKEKTGVEIDGNDGTARQKGYTISWVFNPESGALTVTCSEAPWPASMVPGKIGDSIAEMVQAAIAAEQSS